MAGLQDIAPMVAKRWVTKAVFAPIRAAALAASQPAWPPPITMTSKESAWESHAATSIAELENPEARSLQEEALVSRETLGPPRDPELFHVKHR